MDDFVQFLTGGASKSPTPTNVGNIRPVGSSTGFQQFDTPEAGIKAVDDQLRIYGSKHKLKTLREVISRWAPPSENDTDSYIKNVSQRTGIKPDEEIDLSNPTIRHVISGPIILQEQGLKRLKGTPQTTTQQPQTQPQTQAQPTDDFVSFLTQKPEVVSETKEQTKKSLTPLREDVIKAVAPQSQKTTVGASTTALADIIPNIGASVADLGAYTAARYGLKKSPQEARQIADVYSEGFKSPFAKATGLAGTEEYANAPANKLMDFIGRNVEKGADWIAKNTGMATEDVQNIINAGSFVVPEIASRGFSKIKGKPVSAIDETMIGQFAKRKAEDTGVEAPKQFKSQISEDVLHDVRLKKASELPVPVELTAGQAAQDAVLISRERNERGFKEAHAQRFNEQNKALQDNANIIKQNVAPNVSTTDYVADASTLIDSVKAIKESNALKTKEAYKALEDASGGKFPIDGKKFANNAIEKLTSEDRLDYLPSTIKNKLDSYAAGTKEMNFNLFENLRSDLAAEMRKADRAGDGNMKHVLSVVRDQLENLPMQEGDAALKGLADNARKTAKADFDLEKSNPLYSKVLNEAADSKDFIQNFVIRSKNADFVKSVDLLKNDPVALEHLRSGTMDYIIRESTDASGNFSNAKFTKSIENLNVNKKLDALFGENSKQLKDLAEIAKIVEARPKGSFVNESNTATAIGSAIKEYGSDVIKDIPIVRNIVNPASRILQERKIAKEVKQSLNPKPKTKLSDIGK
jgi:hypothetical protein